MLKCCFSVWGTAWILKYYLSQIQLQMINEIKLQSLTLYKITELNKELLRLSQHNPNNSQYRHVYKSCQTK
jgi:hypothetical protein